MVHCSQLSVKTFWKKHSINSNKKYIELMSLQLCQRQESLLRKCTLELNSKKEYKLSPSWVSVSNKICSFNSVAQTTQKVNTPLPHCAITDPMVKHHLNEWISVLFQKLQKQPKMSRPIRNRWRHIQWSHNNITACLWPAHGNKSLIKIVEWLRDQTRPIVT